MHRQPGANHDVDELRRGEEVALVGGDHVGARVTPLGLLQQVVVLRRHRRRPAAGHGARVGGVDLHRLGDLGLHLGDPLRIHRPGVGAALADRVPPHHVDVVEQRLAVALGEVEHRVVGGDRVVDRLAEVPRLRRDRRRQIAARQQAIRHEADLLGRRVADALGEQADLVVEVRHGAEAAVPPGRVVGARPRRDARLALLVEARVHRRAHLVEHVHDQRVVEVVERIAERRREHHRAGRARLMVVVDDLREPLAIEHPVDVHRLRLVHHVEVAVVVVPHVLLVQPRQVAGAALLRIRVPHVPVGDQLHAVGVGVRGQDDHIPEDAHRLLVGLAGELVDGLDQLLGAEHLGGVQAAVDPDHGLAFLRERTRLVVGQALGVGQPPGDLAVAVQLLEVLGRRDDRHQLVAALGGLADALHDHAIGLGVQLAHVLGELRVVGQHVVGANLVAEELLRRRDLEGCRRHERWSGGRGGLRGGRSGRQPERHQQQGERSKSGVHRGCP